MKLKSLKKSILSVILAGIFISTSTISNAQGYKVFIDPGHGGRDNGSSHNGYLEDQLNLQIAKKVEAKLKEEGISVEMSRDTDKYVSLSDRNIKANNSGADLFISIHQNAGFTSDASGIETYYLNDNDILAKNLQDSLVDYTNARDRGIKTKNLQVLRDSKIPAVLLECGFISNKTEGYRLSTKDYQEKIADGIVDGIKTYFGINNNSKTSNIGMALNHGVAVKSDRGSMFETIGYLSAGTKVQIIDTKYDWHKIKYGNSYGYVSAVYVK